MDCTRVASVRCSLRYFNDKFMTPSPPKICRFYCLQYFLKLSGNKTFGCHIYSITFAVIPRQRSCARSRSRPPQGRCIIFSPVVSAFRILVRQVSRENVRRRRAACLFNRAQHRNSFQYAYRIEEVNTIGTVLLRTSASAH